MLRSNVSRTTALRATWWLIVATLVALSGRLLAQAPADFSVVVLPDTQIYSESHPSIFTQQTQWIVNNRATWNIQFVMHEGDIVHTPSNNSEWVNADASMKVLDNAGIPYVAAIGNHDYDNVLPTARGTVAYNKWFGVSRYSKFPWYLGHLGTTNENFYGTFTVNGQRYIVMALEYYPRDTALSWAASVMQANSDARVLLVTHSFVFTDSTRGDVCDTADMKNTSGRNAETSWEQTLKNQANLQLVVSGHLIGNNTARRSDLGTNRNVVNQVFTNFQNLTNGGSGYLRIFKFRPSLNRIEVYTYSPTLNKFLTDSANQFNLKITNDGNTATTGGISGKVRTTSCTLIGGATVTAGTATATTDANGRYTISNLLEGQYTVSVSAKGYTVPNATSAVFNGYTTQTDFYPTTQNTGSCTLSKTDPSVTICSPAANSTVASPVRINAGTTASSGVQYMQIYVDGLKQQTIFASSLDVNQAMATGSRRLTVQAKLNNGTFVKNTITITVGSGGGTAGVTMTSPVNGSTYTSPVPVNATATSNVAIGVMQLYVDGVKTLEVTGNTLNTTTAMSAGSHVVTVQAVDANNTIYKQSATITVSTSGGSPTVTMTSPLNGGTYSSPVPVNATATSSAAISYMQLYVDGVKTFQVNGKTLNTTSAMAAGTHRVTVQAKDANGLLFKSTVNITVK